MTIVTQPELRELTGSARRANQQRVLDQKGVGYLVRADGSLCTTWEAVNAALCGHAAREEVSIDTGWMRR